MIMILLWHINKKNPCMEALRQFIIITGVNKIHSESEKSF